MEKEYKGSSRKSGVYQIRNLLDGKVYIGCAKEFKTRVGSHTRQLRKGQHHNKHLQSAFNRDGEENFIFEVLEVVDGDYVSVEQTYLDQFLDNWTQCYNFDKEAKATPGRTFSKNPEHTRKLISEASKKLWEEDWYREKMFECNKGNKYNKGRKLTPEHIEKLRQANLGHTYNTGRVPTEEHRQKLSKALKGKVVSDITREKLRQANLGKKHSEETKCRMKETNHMRGKVGSKHPNARPIQQLDKDNYVVKQYPSIVEAAKAVGLKSSSNITLCAKGKRKRAGGYRWRFIYMPKVGDLWRSRYGFIVDIKCVEDKSVGFIFHTNPNKGQEGSRSYEELHEEFEKIEDTDAALLRLADLDE